MGILDKLSRIGLVEREEEDISIPVTTEVPKVEANADINSTENVIAEIYAQNGVSDKENSIYAVQSFIDTLPSEMTTAKKQSSVAGILKVTGKSVNGLLMDAENRVGILTSANDKIIAEKNEVIEAARADIECLKQSIERCEMMIQEAESIKETVSKSVSDEISVIEELVKFCEGMGENK